MSHCPFPVQMGWVRNGPRGLDPYREVGGPGCTTAIIFPRGRIIVVEHISPDRPPTRALCGVPTERHRSTHPYPGLHPGLVCRAPLGHPLESSTALSRPVEATPMNYQRPYLGSLRHCSLLAGDRLCVRGGAGLRDRLLGGFGDRLLGVGGSRVGSAGSSLRSQGGSGGGHCFRAGREGVG